MPASDTPDQTVKPTLQKLILAVIFFAACSFSGKLINSPIGYLLIFGGAIMSALGLLGFINLAFDHPTVKGFAPAMAIVYFALLTFGVFKISVETDSESRHEAANQAQSSNSDDSPKTYTVQATVQSPNVQGQWQCTANENGVSVQSFFLFSDNMFSYSLGNSLRLDSLNLSIQGQTAKGTFTTMTRGTTSGTITKNVQMPFVINFKQSSSRNLAFDMTIRSPKEDQSSSNTCVPLVNNQNAATAQPQEPTQPASTVIMAQRTSERYVAAGATVCFTLQSVIQYGPIRQYESEYPMRPKGGLPEGCNSAPRDLVIGQLARVDGDIRRAVVQGAEGPVAVFIYENDISYRYR